MTSVLNRVRKQTASELDERPVPDSTTIVDRVEFATGQDILLKKDGKYYLGTVVEVDAIREQCFVKFGDNTDSWSCFKDLVKLSTPEEDLMCVVCKKSAPKSRNEIKVCDKCGRGYHRHCHQPHIAIDNDKDDAYWMCKRCIDAQPLRGRKRLSISSHASSSIPKPLPYNSDNLNWDTYHRVNLEQTYCYCGQEGNWDTQMLQCTRCRQWFHDKCLSCLKFPLYCGDRFYVFVCLNCNEGKEFIRRLDMNWVELVHLMLFNLTNYKARKYYDLDAVIVPFINDNWHALQLPPKIYNVSKSERREQILKVLLTNRNRFKCGREVKKRTTIWGLRVRLPPPAPSIHLNNVGVITENELRDRQLCFLPYLESGPVVRVSSDTMLGAEYQDEQPHSETESPCPSPKSDEGEEELRKSPGNFIGAVKKSVPFPKLNLKVKKRLLSLNSRKRDKILRRQKRQNKTAKEAPKRMTRLRLDTGIGAKNKKASSPLTPPTSVSAPPTPPNSGSSSNIHSELSMDYNDSNGFVGSLTKDKRPLDELHTPCDTSGDETSSKSTLDLIIPPPKDFEGKNNPFRVFPRADDNRKRRKKDTISLPLPLTNVISGKPVVRPLKRQLSEKDIFVGPNGEVKRRRLRRGRNGQLNYTTTTTTTATASKTATMVPARPNTADWQQSMEANNVFTNCVDYAFNGRRLRQRQDKIDKEKKPPTPKPSPVKNDPDLSIDDLKSSVNSYFGAATRIQDGERFAIKAKRYGPTGRLEYLMEWEGINSSLQQ